MSAINEILDGIREGKYRMVHSKVAPLQRLITSPELPKGEWIPLYKYHPNTIRAVQRRMKYKFDDNRLMGYYVISD